MNENIYFETSAVNYLFDSVFCKSEFSSLKTKELQLKKNSFWYISSVTLWEIFLTKNEERRYNLFDFSRCLFFDYLIPSPEELLINYLKGSCPKYEIPYELKSKSLFSKEWTYSCKDLNYFFEPDKQSKERINRCFRTISEIFTQLKKGYILSAPNLSETDHRIHNAYLKYVFNTLVKYTGEKPKEEENKYLTIVIYIVFSLLCCGICFDYQYVEDYWVNRKKMEPIERLDVLVKSYPELFFRGPASNIARMICLQLNHKTSRGIYFDSLHSIYTTYCDFYVTNDMHFISFKNDYRDNPNVNKIIDVKNMHFFNPIAK